MAQTRQVQMPPAYFHKAKTEYSDWRWAMIREFIQNSYDAQAANIAFELKVNAADRLELLVSDDGIGMDQDTLENVLLCMGGTRKLDGSIGGFGMAKGILFFAHHSYTIGTRGMLVQGSGGEYTLDHVPDSRDTGTRICVEFGDELSLLPLWRDRIQAYAATCFMEHATGRAVCLSLDGETLPQNNDGIYAFNVQTSLGYMWYDEVKASNRSVFVVSVGGLPMFSETFYSDVNATALVGGIELDAGSLVLTANRDGFKASVRDEFSKIVGRMVQNQSAVRFGRAMDLSINFDGNTASPTSDGAAVVAGAEARQREGGAETPVPRLLMHATAEDPAELSKYTAVLERITRENYPGNFHLKVESLTARRTPKTEAYLTASALVAEMNKQRSAKLARSWRAALYTILNCDWALANGVEFYNGPNKIIDWEAFDGDTFDLQVFFRGRRVDPGFCFIANTEGLCSSVVEGDKPHRIFINPLLLTGETAFRAGDTLDLAYHEAAHLWEHHHGEAFCSVECKLRQSVRRWLSEKEVIARMAWAQAS